MNLSIQRWHSTNNKNRKFNADALANLEYAFDVCVAQQVVLNFNLLAINAANELVGVCKFSPWDHNVITPCLLVKLITP